jgi:hypothetical protein
MDNKQLTQTEIKKIADELSIMEVQLQSTMERIRTLRKIIIPDENGKPRKKTKREERKEIVALAVQRQMAKLLKNSIK